MNVARLNQVSFGLLLVRVIVHIVCIALPHFAHVNNYGVSIEEEPHVNYFLVSQIDYGLFNACGKNNTTESCMTLGASDGRGETLCGASPPLDANIRILQSLSLIGLPFMAGGLGLTGLAIFKESKGDRLRLLPCFICALCCLGGLITAIGDFVFTVSYHDFFQMDDSTFPDGDRILFSGKYRLDWGFGLDIVACVLLALGGGIHIKIARLGSRGGDGIV